MSKRDSMLLRLSTANDSAKIVLYCRIADSYVDDKQINLGLTYVDSAFIFARKKHKLRLESYTYNILGNIYNYLNDFNKALDNFERASVINKKINNKIGLVSNFHNIGNTYFYSGNSKKAEAYYRKALFIYNTGLNDPESLSNTYNNIGSACADQGKLAEAEIYFRKGYDIYIKRNDYISQAYSLNNFGILRSSENKYEEAKQYFEKALELKLKYGDNSQKADGYKALAGAYFNLKKFDLAINNNKKAIEYSDTSVYNSDLKSIYTAIAENYEAVNDLKQSLKYNKLLNRISSQMSDQKDSDELEQKEMMLEYTTAHLNDSLVQASKIEKQQLAIKKSETVRYSLILIISIIILFLAFVFQRFKISQKQKKEIQRQKSIVDEKQKEIIDSINYAKKIQDTLLANEEVIKKNIPGHFILFKPKDIVSGDFYWATEVNTAQEDLFFLAVCDSTGHGVPGAFMSLLSINFINEAINEKHIYEPDKVFNHVRSKLINSISKEDQKDGFDGILLCLDKTKKIITYAAANNNPVLITNSSEFIKLPIDKMPVGKGEKNEDFKLYSVAYQPGDILYLYTDGFADQFGGPKGKKFKYKQLNDLLLEIKNRSMDHQSGSLNQTLENWKNGLEQVDDICIVGIKL